MIYEIREFDEKSNIELKMQITSIEDIFFSRVSGWR